MIRWQNLWRLIPLWMVLLLAGCGDPTTSALRPRGPVARDQLFLMKLSFGIMILVVVVVFVIYLYVLVRFRQKKGEKDIVPKQVEGSHTLELIWTVIPIILLLILAVPTVQYTFKALEDHRGNQDALHVKVTAHAFWWQFEYPSLGIATAQDLVIPTGKKIAFEITASDVKHSFWIPSLGGKMDTNPGLNNIFYLQADEVDTFKGICAELCGASHALMLFKVNSLDPANFDKWVADMKAPATIPADAKRGEQVFKDNCLSCHAVNAQGLGAGPNLNGFAKREMVAGILPHNDESLRKWILDPQAQKPGNKMPAFGPNGPKPLGEQDVNDLIKYLNALQ
ncbi:cytochrome c oxidase subunit II [Paenibacillus silviterrae]|jgi:cytochrome c oxidase subunit II|uniref:cytochrome c oxidase subunit II n=1 Tax=Paenibacillus silviterrae TaxID=3242194 RepID=UPI002543DE43|nr:cytochrome c oxidase subunit II [Paenibacillus chinjuensis]